MGLYKQGSRMVEPTYTEIIVVTGDFKGKSEKGLSNNVVKKYLFYQVKSVMQYLPTAKLLILKLYISNSFI